MVSKYQVALDIGRVMGKKGWKLSKLKTYDKLRQYLEHGHSIGMWEKSCEGICSGK